MPTKPAQKAKAKAEEAPRRKRALGRGLEALFPDMKTVAGDSRDFFQCDITDISPNRYQSRTLFSEQELSELADSIRREGVIQPIMVRRVGTGFELVAGERRLRAAKMAGLTQVPVIVREVDDRQHLVFSIVENVQRENLNPMEEAEGYHRLVAEFGFSQEQVAEHVGKNRTTVTNLLRLRKLPDYIQKSITAGQLTMGHARALLAANTPQQQNAAWKEILARGLSVRQTEALVKRSGTEPKPAAGKKTADSAATHLSSLAEKFSRIFGTKVNIIRKGRRGKIEIEFYNDEDLNRLLEMMDK
ncbi:MAG: ParB/RepB/Spo0J family partition protein [Thermodesulfobacteriota bacterium]